MFFNNAMKKPSAVKSLPPVEKIVSDTKFLKAAVD